MSVMRMILGTPRWSRRLFEVQTTVTWTQVTQTLVHQPLAVVKRTWRLESPRVGDVWPRTLFSGFVRFVHTLSPTLVHTENRQMVLEGKSLLPRMTPKSANTGKIAVSGAFGCYIRYDTWIKALFSNAGKSWILSQLNNSKTLQPLFP